MNLYNYCEIHCKYSIVKGVARENWRVEFVYE